MTSVLNNPSCLSTIIYILWLSAGYANTWQNLFISSNDNFIEPPTLPDSPFFAKLSWNAFANAITLP